MAANKPRAGQRNVRTRGNDRVDPADLQALEKLAPRPAKRSARNMHGLTSKQETFANLVVDGYSYVAAYRAAYDIDEDAKPTSHYHSAHMIANHPNVAQRILQLQHQINEEHRALSETRAARVTATLERLMSSAATDNAKLRAAELLGKTVGLFAEASKDDKTAQSVADLEAQLNALLDQKVQKQPPGATSKAIPPDTSSTDTGGDDA